MGCTASRHDNQNLQKVQEAEKILGFYDKCCNDVNNAFHRIQATETLTEKQLNYCLEKACLPTSKKDQKVDKFYQNFYKDANQKNYDLLKLNIAGIVMACGDKEAKAKLIFENLDRQVSGKVTKDQLEFYAKIVIPLSTQWVVNLADSQIEVEKEWAEVDKQKLFFSQQFPDNSNELDLNTFLQKVNLSQSDWFSTFGIREALIKAQAAQKTEQEKKTQTQGEPNKQQTTKEEKKEENKAVAGK